MRPNEESNCRCCKDCSGFKQIIDLQNVGLVIYRYSSPVKEADGKSNNVDTPTGDVYIVHNTSNTDITTNEYFSELGQFIKCARCRYLFQHAEKLMKKVSHIDKFGIIGLCDYCKDRIPCEHCYEVLKKFIASKNKETKKINDFIQWLNNVKYCLKNNKLQSRSLSNLHLNKERHFTLDPKIIQELRKSQLQGFETLRDTGQAEIQQQDMSINGSLHGTPIGGAKTESDVEKSKRCFFDTNSNLIENSDIGFSLQKRKDLKFPLKYTHISQDAINVNVHDFDLRNLLHKRDINYLSFDNLDDRSSDHFPLKGDYPEEPNLTRSHPELSEFLEKKRTNLDSIEFNSQEAFVKFDEGIAQRSLEKDFSFFFIKPKTKLNTPTKYKSSSELIRDTKDMIRERTEKQKQKPLTEIKFKGKEIKILKEDNNKTKSKTLIEEIKEKIPMDDEQKILDIETKKNTTNEPEMKKKTKENIDKLSHTLSKKEKDKEMKNEAKKKIIDKDLLNSEKVSTKVKKESEKDQKLKENEQKSKESEQKNKTKKEPPLDLNKKELNSEQNKPKSDANKFGKDSSTKDNIEDYKKLLAEQKKQKEEEDKLKKREEEEKMKRKEAENKQMKEAMDKMLKAEAVMKQQNDKESKPEKQTEVKTKTETKSKGKETGDLKPNQIKVRKPSTDDLILQLVRLKQSQHSQNQRVQPKRLEDIDIDPSVIKLHKGHQNKRQSSCAICNDSELELDIENIDKGLFEKKEVADIIIGQQIFKYKPHSEENVNKTAVGPIIFTSTFDDDAVNIQNHNVITNNAAGDMEKKPFSAKIVEQEVPKGIIRYALSDRTFIDKGWTMLPTEKVVRKMNVYRMRPAHPEFDWFEHNKNKKLMHYDTGEKLAEFDDDGRGRWFYRNGKLALDYYDAKEINAQQRFVIYSSGEPDERGRSRPLVILATFDYLGNGIVFDHAGKIRLKYNQTEGVVLDRSIGPVSHWKWHTLNDPPVLQQVMIDTQMAHKDPEIFKLGGPGDDKPRPDNEEMLAIEFDNFIKEKSKKLSQKFKPFQIKMKALKINEHFSLKVLDQATVYLIYRDGSINLKVNIGMILDHKEIVDTDTAEVGEVSNSLERFPARTDSLAGLQKSVAYAQRVERSRVERERRLRPTMSYTDNVNAIVSRPLRTPLDRVPTSFSVTTSAYRCRCRKSSSCQLYYDTRLT